MIENFIEYMWYLLTTPLKKLKKALNKWYILCDVFGRRFDEVKEDILRAREEGMVATCSYEMLPVHGADRRLTRYEGEHPENYRSRIAMYEEICRLGGTNKGIQLAVAALGFGQVEIVPVKEYYGDSKRWAEFIILIQIDLSNTFPISLKILRIVVRKWKEVGAKDNYLIKASAYIMDKIRYLDTVHIQINFSPQLNLEFHYLEGGHYLEGTKRLNGYSTKKIVDLYPVLFAWSSSFNCKVIEGTLLGVRSSIRTNEKYKVSNTYDSPVKKEIIIKKDTQIELRKNIKCSYIVKVTAESHLRYLDGNGVLDGKGYLNADIYYYEL